MAKTPQKSELMKAEGDSFFKSVDAATSDEYVLLILSDGTITVAAGLDELVVCDGWDEKLRVMQQSEC